MTVPLNLKKPVGIDLYKRTRNHLLQQHISSQEVAFSNCSIGNVSYQSGYTQQTFFLINVSFTSQDLQLFKTIEFAAQKIKKRLTTGILQGTVTVWAAVQNNRVVGPF